MTTGSNQIFQYPLPGGLEPDYRLMLDVFQLDIRLGDSVVLNVSWMVKKNQADASYSGFKKSIIKQADSGNGYDVILQRFSGVEVKPLFYYSTIPAHNVLETYTHSLNASSADCSRLQYN